MMVSVVVPCRNEVRFIGECLDSILGGAVQLVDNPRRTTPAALNAGIARARGDAVLIMGAHASYPSNYVSRLVHWLERSGADCVGGCCVTLPAADTATARAIAMALSCRFGIGNAHFRVGTTQSRWVDTVAFGCYRRETFERVGVFDEELVRNQDDEFNLRLGRLGGRILLVPDVVAHYYARESFRKLWRMYYQYGYLKPLVARKVGAILTVRQVVPAAFVGAVAATLALAAWWTPAMGLLVGLVGAYTVADVAAAAPAIRKEGLRCALALALAFPVIHAGYGVGFWRGILDFVVLGKRPRRVAADLALSR
jgi:glycosyltransferase involved in cell wall biosynthesis